MQEIKLIITEQDGKVNTRVEGLASDIHIRMAKPVPEVTVTERIALVAMDACINAMQGFGLGETDI